MDDVYKLVNDFGQIDRRELERMAEYTRERPTMMPGSGSQLETTIGTLYTPPAVTPAAPTATFSGCRRTPTTNRTLNFNPATGGPLNFDSIIYDTDAYTLADTTRFNLVQSNGSYYRFTTCIWMSLLAGSITKGDSVLLTLRSDVQRWASQSFDISNQSIGGSAFSIALTTEIKPSLSPLSVELFNETAGVISFRLLPAGGSPGLSIPSSASVQKLG